MTELLQLTVTGMACGGCDVAVTERAQAFRSDPRGNSATLSDKVQHRRNKAVNRRWRCGDEKEDQRMEAVKPGSSRAASLATVLWTRTTAMSITAAVMLAAMKPMMRSPVLSAMTLSVLRARTNLYMPIVTRILRAHFVAEIFCSSLLQSCNGRMSGASFHRFPG